MPPLVLPSTLTPGTFENVNDVSANFTALRTLVNGGLDGANLSQSTGEALSVSGTNIPRRGAETFGLDPTQTVVLTGTYQRLKRAPTVVMPTGGLLHVAAFGEMQIMNAVTWRLCVQLNGVIAKSRFGTAPASGASVGLMERVMSTASSTMTLWYTDPGDTGLGSLDSLLGYPDSPAYRDRMLTAFIPIVVGPGSFVVDVCARQDAGPALVSVNVDAIIFVKTEAF